jgi:hypothetical protein
MMSSSYGENVRHAKRETALVFLVKNKVIGHRELRGETLHEGNVFWSLIVNNARRVSFKWCAGEDIEDFVYHTLLTEPGG